MFHSSLTLSKTIVLERLQAKALKAIYGFKPSYRELMEMAGLTTLIACREAREISFARKNATLVRFAKWFPLHESNRTTRGQYLYKESYARCTRC